MNVAAEKHQFIVIYPQGLKQDWNVGFGMAYQKGIDDVGFTKALLEHMVNDYRVDQEAVYATGLCRGGFFCHRLAAELPYKFAAIASVGGPLPIPSPIFIETR
jgi:polyhydroxybutyrate depolymerase